MTLTRNAATAAAAEDVVRSSRLAVLETVGPALATVHFPVSMSFILRTCCPRGGTAQLALLHESMPSIYSTISTFE